MPLTRLVARNYRSFKELDVRTGPLTVVIGPNAAGKSNLLSIIQFLRQTANFGFANAVRSNGGSEFIRNVHSKDKYVELGVEAKNTLSHLAFAGLPRRAQRRLESAGVMTSSYRIRFAPDRTAMSPVILEELLRVRFPAGPTKRKAGPGRGGAGEAGYIELRRAGTSLRVRVRSAKNLPPQLSALLEFLRRVRRVPIAEGVSFIDNPTTQPFVAISFPDLFGSAFYRLEPTKERESTNAVGPPSLNVDGSNLALIAWNVAQDPRKKARMMRLVKDFLPFVSDLEVEMEGEALRMRLTESSAKGHALPASILSDGTLDILSLVLALNFEQRPLIVLEEPEKSIHAGLLSRLMAAVVALSTREQVILTTHNPEVLRHAPIDSLLLLSRDSEGNSVASRPGTSARIRGFLKQDLGVPELFVMGQLS